MATTTEKPLTDEEREILNAMDPEAMSVIQLRAWLSDAQVRWSSQDTIKAVRHVELPLETRQGMANEVQLRKDELVELVRSVREGTTMFDPPAEIEGEVVEETDEPAPPRSPEEEAAEAHSQALALREEPVVSAPALLPTVGEFTAMREMAAAIANTQMVPKAYRNKPDDVLAAILTGREMNMGPMQSLRDIFVIDGKPALAAHLLLSRMRAGGVKILESESTAERAWIRAQRMDTGEIAEVEWTYAEAQEVTVSSWHPTERGVKVDMPLTDKDNWRNYRPDMLWARAVGRLARRLGPDLIGSAMPFTSEEVEDWDDYTSPVDTGPGRQQSEPRPRTAPKRAEPQWEAPKDWKELMVRIARKLSGSAEPSQMFVDETTWWLKETHKMAYSADSVAQLSPADNKEAAVKWSQFLFRLEAVEGDLAFADRLRDLISGMISEHFGVAPVGPPWRLGPDETTVPTWYEHTGNAEPERPEITPEQVDAVDEQLPDADPGDDIPF